MYHWVDWVVKNIGRMKEERALKASQLGLSHFNEIMFINSILLENSLQFKRHFSRYVFMKNKHFI